MREAQPSDARFLGEVALLATREHVGWGLFDVLFGLPDEEMITALAAATGTRARFFHHYSWRLVAEMDGEPAGAIAAFPFNEQMRQTFIPALNEISGGHGVSRVAERWRPWQACSTDPPEGAWVLDLVATLPPFRGHGVAGALLGAGLDAGRQAGCSQAVVTHQIGNEPAERAFRSAGFATADERRHPDFERSFRSAGLVRAHRGL